MKVVWDPTSQPSLRYLGLHSSTGLSVRTRVHTHAHTRAHSYTYTGLCHTWHVPILPNIAFPHHSSTYTPQPCSHRDTLMCTLQCFLSCTQVILGTAPSQCSYFCRCMFYKNEIRCSFAVLSLLLSDTSGPSPKSLSVTAWRSAR